MLDDPALIEQLHPHVLREREMGCVIAVEMPDLAAADLERKLTAPARAGDDARP
jgi:hypothetical protein